MGLLTPLAVRLGRQPWLPRVLPAVVAVDRLLLRVTGGRLTLLDLAGLPNLYLTVPGRRSGEPRTTPLLCVPYRGGYLVAGSHVGSTVTPQWALNLRAAGRAQIRVAGRSQSVAAREVTGPERDRLFAEMSRTWPNYPRYAERAGRPIPVFELRQNPGAPDRVQQ